MPVLDGHTIPGGDTRKNEVCLSQTHEGKTGT